MKNLLTALLLGALSVACSHPNEGAATGQEADQSTIAINHQSQKTNDMPGLIHNVFFWLREDLSAAEEAAFLEGVKSLNTISTVKAFYLGPPASTEKRDVVDNSFSYALLVHFDDIEGQNAYQIDPIHLKFVEDHQDKWTRVTVYDNSLID